MKKTIILLLIFTFSPLSAKRERSCCEYEIKTCRRNNPHKDKLYKRPHHVFKSNYFGPRFPGYYDPFWYGWPGYYEWGYPYYGRGGVGFNFAVGV